MPPPDETRLRKLAGILAASERAGGPGPESLDAAEDGVPANAKAVIDRVSKRFGGAAAEMPCNVPAPAAAGGAGGGDGTGDTPAASAAGDPPGKGDSAKRAAALERLFHFGRSALAKIGTENFGLTQDEGCAMEALVIADGSRPSFILRGGKYDRDDPFVGAWAGPLAAARNAIGGIAAAVGRIQPAGGDAKTYIGTGTLVNAVKGLVLTNYHVVVQARDKHHIAMHQDGDHFVVDGVLEIDFAGESGSFETRRFRIVEIRVPVGAGEVFQGIDAAVCRIVPLDAGVTLPAAIAPVSADPDYATGAASSLALIGFPGQPAMSMGDEVDWDWVIRTLFRNRFGIKRLAPGRFTHGLGFNPADKIAQRAIGHDATTFGGASGSLVVAWLDSGTPAFALHFAGETSESNYALSLARTRAALEPLGVPFQPGL